MQFLAYLSAEQFLEAGNGIMYINIKADFPFIYGKYTPDAIRTARYIIPGTQYLLSLTFGARIK